MRNRTTFHQFKEAFRKHPLLSVSDISKTFPNMHRRRLHEWCTKGLMTHVMKGYYLFPDSPIKETSLYLIANKIYEPSYVSMQSALNWYGLIPEFVPQITSVSTKKTTTLKTSLGNFSYFSIKNSLLFGFDLVELAINNEVYNFKIASPEKALLDYLYLNPHISSLNHFEELRLNVEGFKKLVDPTVLAQYMQVYPGKNFSNRVLSLVEYMNNA